MNKTLFALIFILCNAIASAADAVDVRVSSSADEVRAGETFYVNFKFSIPKGQHIYSAEESDLGQPTAIKLSLPQGYSLKNIEFPKPEKFTALGMESLGYSRDFSVSAAVSAPENIPESSSVNIRADATWLACSDLCVPGEKSQEIPIRQIKSSASGESAGVPPDKTPLFTVLLAAFLGGAILNLMPCVFPVIGLKILSFAEGAGGSKKSALAGAFFYSLGIVASFLALSAVLLAFRSLGENLGWGFQLQNPMFTSLMVMLFFAMALSFAGVFEIGAGFAGGNVQKNDSNKPEWKKHISAVFSGVLAVLVASPCTAPFMGSAMGAALAADASNSLCFGVFAMIGLGMASPYVALSAIPALARAMPRPGAWMDILKQLLSIPLFATVIWLVWVYSNQTGNIVAILSALLILAVGARIFGMFYMPHLSRLKRALSLAAFALSAAAAVFVSYPGEISPAVEVENPAGDKAQSWSPALQEKLIKDGKNVYVDFTASWCLTCQYNKQILHSPEIMELFKKNNVVILAGDWTNKNPQITKELEKFGRAGVPLNLLYSHKNPDAPQVLPAILTKSLIIDAVDKIR